MRERERFRPIVSTEQKKYWVWDRWVVVGRQKVDDGQPLS